MPAFAPRHGYPHPGFHPGVPYPVAGVYAEQARLDHIAALQAQVAALVAIVPQTPAIIAQVAALQAEIAALAV